MDFFYICLMALSFGGLSFVCAKNTRPYAPFPNYYNQSSLTFFISYLSFILAVEHLINRVRLKKIYCCGFIIKIAIIKNISQKYTKYADLGFLFWLLIRRLCGINFSDCPMQLQYFNTVKVLHVEKVCPIPHYILLFLKNFIYVNIFPCRGKLYVILFPKLFIYRYYHLILFILRISCLIRFLATYNPF